MDTNIQRIRISPYDEAINAAAWVLSNADYTRDTDPRDVDNETTWEVAKAMMAVYLRREGEMSSSLSEFMTEPGGFAPMVQMLVDEDGLEFYEKARARARMYATGFLPEAIERLDSASEIARDRHVDQQIKEVKETA